MLGTVTTWELGQTGETATGPTLAVAADGALVGVVSALWSDVDGVRLSVDWHRDLDDLSASETRALAAALIELANAEPPAA
jgi:hypothetical protein